MGRQVCESPLGGTQTSLVGNKQGPEELLQEYIQLLQEFWTGDARAARCWDAEVRGGRGTTIGEASCHRRRGDVLEMQAVRPRPEGLPTVYNWCE